MEQGWWGENLWQAWNRDRDWGGGMKDSFPFFFRKKITDRQIW